MQATKFRVLVIDDDLAFLQSLARAFRKDEKIELETQTSPRMALRLLEAGHYDALLTDWKMPTINGTEFLSLAALRYPRIPRGLITGVAALEEVSNAVNNARLTWVFLKPLQVQSFRSQLLKELES